MKIRFHISSSLKIMNKIISLKKIEYSYVGFFVASLILMAGMIFMAGSANAATFTQLTAQLDYGQTSVNVRNLQIFLASSPSIYPQGLVTGYFGPLTKSAVMNFQNAYGISQVGRVGPQTLAKINSLIASGVGLTGAGGFGNNTISPTIYSNANLVIRSNTSATFSWSTSEPTKSVVYYSTAPFQLMEATTNFARPTIMGGLTTQQTGTFQINQSVTVQNLQPNTIYYYMIEAADADGNFSYLLPATFSTNQ